MKLSDWLSAHAVSVQDFAQRIEHTRASVYYWLAGERNPGLAAVQRIIEATHGMVGLRDFPPLRRAPRGRHKKRKKDTPARKIAGVRR